MDNVKNNLTVPARHLPSTQNSEAGKSKGYSVALAALGITGLVVAVVATLGLFGIGLAVVATAALSVKIAILVGATLLTATTTALFYKVKKANSQISNSQSASLNSIISSQSSTSALTHKPNASTDESKSSNSTKKEQPEKKKDAKGSEEQTSSMPSSSLTHTKPTAKPAPATTPDPTPLKKEDAKDSNPTPSKPVFTQTAPTPAPSNNKPAPVKAPDLKPAKKDDVKASNPTPSKPAFTQTAPPPAPSNNKPASALPVPKPNDKPAAKTHDPVPAKKDEKAPAKQTVPSNPASASSATKPNDKPVSPKPLQNPVKPKEDEKAPAGQPALSNPALSASKPNDKPVSPKPLQNPVKPKEDEKAPAHSQPAAPLPTKLNDKPEPALSPAKSNDKPASTSSASKPSDKPASPKDLQPAPIKPKEDEKTSAHSQPAAPSPTKQSDKPVAASSPAKSNDKPASASTEKADVKKDETKVDSVSLEGKTSNELWDLLQQRTISSNEMKDFLISIEKGKEDGQVNSRYADVYCAKKTAIQVGKKYIHANRVGKNFTERAFIASQAPVPKDYDLFWKSIFDNDHFILDLTGADDLIKEDRKLYYPKPGEKPMTFGSFEVAYKTTEHGIHFYTVTDKSTGNVKEIPRLHYTSWADLGAVKVIELHNLIKKLQTSFKASSFWIHCRAGIGRTGTFITAYILNEKIAKGEITKDNLKTSLVNLIFELRKERDPSFVQTDVQFDLLVKYGEFLLNGAVAS